MPPGQLPMKMSERKPVASDEHARPNNEHLLDSGAGMWGARGKDECSPIYSKSDEAQALFIFH